ncbi:hypothetical protein BDZ85DRAFT_266495 [Elsinoe ampelina]|uniref:Uncharacterized protein n=1 Tax=Elsinoe ampelina TaxID=302913 RepID=A0A6A6G659_9PEZI|nr:hypothetical protein BDZ85DRAFT_266495 [Elsinoe ampelina]
MSILVCWEALAERRNRWWWVIQNRSMALLVWLLEIGSNQGPQRIYRNTCDTLSSHQLRSLSLPPRGSVRLGRSILPCPFQLHPFSFRQPKPSQCLFIFTLPASPSMSSRKTSAPEGLVGVVARQNHQGTSALVAALLDILSNIVPCSKMAGRGRGTASPRTMRASRKEPRGISALG